jgi:CubicO group peptidase (beta-lactamase class C family)
MAIFKQFRPMSPQSGSLAQSLQPFVDKGLIAGAVGLAATKDNILSLEAVGCSDLATKKPMTIDSFFWIASMTKPMTATAFMMLVDEGKVHLDDPVEKYVPEFKGQMMIAEKDDEQVVLKKPQHPITVREILSHTAGLSFSSAIETPTFDKLELCDRVRSYASMQLQFEPGSQFAYSNAGTNTAGRIIEVITGMRYEVFMDRHLLGPLRMDDTTFWPNEEQIGRLAKIYRSKDDKSGLEETTLAQLSYPFHSPARRVLPAGGLFSNASDVVKFCQMLLNGGVREGRRYVSEASIREMTRRQTAETIEVSSGLCWFVGKSFGHGGAYKTHIDINPELGLITVLLLHHTNDWHDEEGKNLLPTFSAAVEKLL